MSPRPIYNLCSSRFSFDRGKRKTQKHYRSVLFSSEIKKKIELKLRITFNQNRNEAIFFSESKC